jgi:hypothetical protein
MARPTEGQVERLALAHLPQRATLTHMHMRNNALQRVPTGPFVQRVRCVPARAADFNDGV